MIPIKAHLSANFDERPSGAVIKYIILHYTEGNLTDSLAWLTGQNPLGQKVSAHYLICPQGEIYQLVPEQKRAWHAGVSQWGQDKGLNATSIGIELVNDGKSPYPNAQMRSLIHLLKDIMPRHQILPEHILGHDDIAPGRKNDPGHHFDWPQLAKNGVGVHPRLYP